MGTSISPAIPVERTTLESRLAAVLNTAGFRQMSAFLAQNAVIELYDCPLYKLNGVNEVKMRH